VGRALSETAMRRHRTHTDDNSAAPRRGCRAVAVDADQDPRASVLCALLLVETAFEAVFHT